jgi:hypothetical protein
MGIASDWTKYKFQMYPTMYEYTFVRSYSNSSQEAVTAPTENHSVPLRSYCNGSPSTSPPWSGYFATLFDTTIYWNGTTGGTVNAGMKRTWELRNKNDGGEEGWMGSNPVSGPFDRLRIDRHSPTLLSYEEPLSQGGG